MTTPPDVLEYLTSVVAPGASLSTALDGADSLPIAILTSLSPKEPAEVFRGTIQYELRRFIHVYGRNMPVVELLKELSPRL